jgi:hypothetical protein
MICLKRLIIWVYCAKVNKLACRSVKGCVNPAQLAETVLCDGYNPLASDKFGSVRGHLD